MGYASTATPSRGRPMEGEDSDVRSSDHPNGDNSVTIYPTGGINRALPPQQIDDDECRDIMNMRYARDGQLLTTRPGLDYADASLTLPGPIIGVHVLRYGDASAKTICVALNSFTTPTNADPYYLTDAGAWVKITVPGGGLGSMDPPCIVTFGGCAIIACKGQYLREWQPTQLAGDAEQTHATGTVTFDTSTPYVPPAVDDSLTIGNQVFLFKTTREAVGQVTIGATGAATATNLVTAIMADCFDVEAAAATNVVTVTARRGGTVGNSVPFAIVKVTSAAFTVSGSGTLAGAQNSPLADTIDTPNAPKPEFLIPGLYSELIGAGDPTERDRVFFCAPRDAWNWDTAGAGNGEYYDTGWQDGTKIVAIQTYLTEVMVHRGRAGNRQIKRIEISDPDPATWSVILNGILPGSSALNHRVVASHAGKHFYMDTRGFMMLEGTDTYDEVGAQAIGAKVGDMLSAPVMAEAFFVEDPDDLTMLVFPAEGRSCCVFHYGSGRWTRYQFFVGSLICGCYDQPNQRVLLGDASGRLLKLNPDISADLGTAFPSRVQFKSYVEGGFKNTAVKRALLDYDHVRLGSGYVDLVINNDTLTPQRLGEFAVIDSALTYFAGGATELYDADDLYYSGGGTQRVGLFENGEGELVAPRVTLTSGAMQLNSLTMEFANEGRSQV